MINKENIKGAVLVGVVASAIILLSQFAVNKWNDSSNASFGAAGGLLIENYDPYVRSNGGINTALPIQTSGGLVNSGTLAQSGAAAFTSTLTVGANGTALSQIVSTTSDSVIGNASVTASTTKAFDFALTGVTSGDTCFAQAGTTTQSFLGMSIIGANASATAGFVTVLVSNPGATAVLPYSIASSTHITCFTD